MVALDPGLPALPCPECMERAHRRLWPRRDYGGRFRVGNQRRRCRTCNNFAQNVMRLTRKRLLEKYADEYRQLRLQVELDLYPQVVEEWDREHPEVLAAMREREAS